MPNELKYRHNKSGVNTVRRVCSFPDKQEVALENNLGGTFMN